PKSPPALACLLGFGRRHAADSGCAVRAMAHIQLFMFATTASAKLLQRTSHCIRSGNQVKTRTVFGFTPRSTASRTQWPALRFLRTQGVSNMCFHPDLAGRHGQPNESVERMAAGVVFFEIRPSRVRRHRSLPRWVNA